MASVGKLVFINFCERSRSTLFSYLQWVVNRKQLVSLERGQVGGRRGGVKRLRACKGTFARLSQEVKSFRRHDAKDGQS